VSGHAVSFDSAVARLMSLGYDRDLAVREVQRQILRVEPTTPASAQPAAQVTRLELPFSIVLPWSVLVSDDHRVMPIVDPKTGKASIRLTDEYRTARQTIQARLRERLGGGPISPAPLSPVAEPIELLARVWVPDNRVHDVPNFAKGVHDAMARQVFTNDAWIYRAVWERAGVDVDRPRAEITISQFAQ
jgi:Holliday junction resolvase RusA-like endonuclease